MNERKVLPFAARKAVSSDSVRPGEAGLQRTAAEPPASSKIKSMMGNLKLWHRVQAGQEIGAAEKQVIIEAAVNWLEGEKQKLLHQILLEVDFAKKQALVEAMKRGSYLDLEIKRESSAFELEIFNELSRSILEFAKRAKLNIATYRTAYERDEITHNDLEMLSRRMDDLKEQLIDNADGKVQVILVNYSSRIQQTLDLFTERMVR